MANDDGDDADHYPDSAGNLEQEHADNNTNAAMNNEDGGNAEETIMRKQNEDSEDHDAAADDADADDDDDAAAMEMMMAFQERQQAAEDPGRAANNRVDEFDNLHPRVAFLGQYEDHGDGTMNDADADAVAEGEDQDNIMFNNDNNNNNDNDNDNDNDNFIHPNHNNPAAIALRQHQLRLQNQAANRRHHPHNWNQHHPLLLRSLTSLLPPSLFRYTPLSLLAAAALLHHTLRSRQQFYLALLYLQSSKLSYIVLGNAIIALAVSSFSLTTSLFLEGGLRHNERDAISEHIRWDVTETCLALTIFRSELDISTAIMFLGLVVLKCLHWSVELRGGHLRMTEEVFVYPHGHGDQDHPRVDDDDHHHAAAADGHDDVAAGGGTANNTTENHDANSSVRRRKPWYQRLPRLRLSHIRFYTLLQILLLLDILAVAHCAVSVATNGPSVHILFGFESAILLVAALNAMGMYHLHVVDGIMGALCHWCEGEHHYCPVGGMAVPDDNDNDNSNGTNDDGNENQEVDNRENSATNPRRSNSIARKLVEHLANPWRDRRATYSFVIELQAQAAKFLFYVVFFAIVFTYYGMPINIFREVYVSFQQLRTRIIAFNNYRRLTHNMEKRFDNIQDEEELDRLGHTCIICRDHMDLLGGCKKLPGCGHAFHTHCLREWMVQQQTCPTCRADIAANEARRKREREAEAAAVAAEIVADMMEGDAAEADGVGDSAEVTRESALPVGNDQNQQQALQGDQGQTERVEQSGVASSIRIRQPTPTIREQRDATRGDTTSSVASNAATATSPSHDSTITSTTTIPPVASVHLPTVSESSPFSTPSPNPHFPCLYRITSPLGASVFSSSAMPPQQQQRIIPHGKLIVCLSIEYWPMPFQQVMYRMPDGYLKGRDVERYLPLVMPAEMFGSSRGEDGLEFSRRNGVSVATA